MELQIPSPLPVLPESTATGPTAIRRQPEPRQAERLYVSICWAVEPPLAVLLLLAVFLTMNLVRTPHSFDDFLALRVTVKNLLMVVGFTLAWRLMAAGFGVYTWHLISSRRAEAFRVFGLCTFMSCLALIFPAISFTGAFGYATVICFWLVSVPVFLGGRAFLRSFATGNVAPVRDVLIVGSGVRAVDLFNRITEDSTDRRVVGFVDTIRAETPETVRSRLLGGMGDLEGLLMHQAIDEVFIALPMKSCYEEIQEVIRVCQRVGVRARYSADFFNTAWNGSRVGTDPLSVVDVPIAKDDHRLMIKRAVDVVGALTGIILLSPLLLIVAAAIKLSSPGPVLFAGERYGYNRRRFRMLKFRTMVHNAEQLQRLFEDQNEVAGPVFKIRQDPRMTHIGRILRRTSVDELPQLINVLRGDMSLVGPRPLPTRDVQRFTEAALMRRFSVRPGITCLWQVSGRSNLSFDDWIALDLRYIDQWSLSLDFMILARTLPAVLKGTGAA